MGLVDLRRQDLSEVPSRDVVNHLDELQLALFDLLAHGLDVLLARFAQDGYLLQELAALSLSREERSECYKLSKYATNCPNVNLV